MSHNNCTRPDGNKGCIDCVAYGAVEEQERIIKLLEELCLKHLPWCGKRDCVKCEQTMGIEQAMIAITEGENK